MTDIDLDRKIASNWKEYLQGFYDIKQAIVWVWNEFVNQKGKQLAKKMFWATVITYIVAVAKPWTLGLVFSGLIAKNAQGSLVIIGLGLCVVVIFIGQIMNYKRFVYRELLLGENGRQLLSQTNKLFFEKSLGTHVDEGNLLNKANVEKGCNNMTGLRDAILFEGSESILGLVIPFCALWFIDWLVAIIVSLMLIFHLVCSLFISQKMMEVGIPIDQEWRALNRFRVERWDQIERVKTNYKEDDELKKMDLKFEGILRLDIELYLWFIAQLVKRGSVDCVFLVVVMIYGAYQVWHGQMSIGLLYPLYAWSSQLTDNLWRIDNLERKINLMTPSILSTKEALTMPVGLSVADSPKYLPKDACYRIEFKNVNYSYPGQKDKKNITGEMVSVLRNVSFTIEPGERVAIIGKSGIGKSTIKSLLMRYFDPTSGSILIDGIDLRDLDTGSWLQSIGYVPQKDQILNGTIRYNLLYGLTKEQKKKITDQELLKIMDDLQINFGERLTHGLDTLVGRNGVKLSGGQAQRVMIGAAVIKNPRFMIIDEATSSLDSTTEKLVQQGLEKVLIGNRGALIITHRLNTVRRICNKFIMLSGNGGGGEVIAIAGSIEELATKSSEFRSLAKDQGIII